MIERVIENWLTKVNEKSFQIPFCQLLAGEGYQVLHLSRHGPAEEGKDVIAIAPDGVPCAFQLKGSVAGRITLKEWQQFVPQIDRLIEIPIVHPSVGKSKKRRVYFVTNGDLDEEVRFEIAHRNLDSKSRRLPELQTIVKGNLLNRFQNIHTNLWPAQLTSEKDLLELFLADGTGYLDKPKFSSFLGSLLFSDDFPTKAESPRDIASAAIFASYAFSPFEKMENHVAVIEGWVIYLAYICGFVEKNKVNNRLWIDSANLAIMAIEDALSDLVSEVIDRRNFVAGNALVDSPFYSGRLTWLIGFISVYIIWKIRNDPNWSPEAKLSEYIINNIKKLRLWGEASTPQFLAIFWALNKIGYSYMGDRLLYRLINGLIIANQQQNGLPDPYHSLGEVILNQVGLSDTLSDENFAGRSYSLELIVQLLARRGFRGVLNDKWKNISHLHYVSFDPKENWQFCLWQCEDGIYIETMPKETQSWSELVLESNRYDISKIPELFNKRPEMLLIFLIVYPHRLSPNVGRYLDNIFS